MYELFIKNSTPKLIQPFTNNYLNENMEIEIKMLFKECGGYSFNNGQYRIHTPETSLHWSALISNYFPKYKKLIPFGFDWMGRHFSIDKNRKNCILMFDPATAEDFELDEDLITFHNHDLIYEKESFLSEELFNRVRKELKTNEINYDECCGYKTPLFLNGSDTLDNYEVSNMEVYWEIQYQIYLQTKDLPPGTKINSIKFE